MNFDRRQRFLQLILCAALSVFLCNGAPARAEFLDVVTLAPGFGGVGTFTGVLDGVPLAGFLTVGLATAINPDPGPLIGGSTIGGTSPQHSYGDVYTPSVLLSDRIGFSAVAVDAPTMGHIKIVFAKPFTNPVLHVANLDRTFLDFSSTAGLGPLILLSGNGGADIDGLFVGGAKVFDGAPLTADLVPDGFHPPLAGSRSAYGSILIVGKYPSLDFDLITLSGIENATFTLSSIPEPSSLVLAGLGIACLVVARRKLNR